MNSNFIILLLIAFVAYYVTKRWTRNTFTAVMVGVASIIVAPLIWEQLTM
jgi:hypothetical protein